MFSYRHEAKEPINILTL